MTKSKSLVSYIFIPPIFVIYSVDGAEFLNNTCVSGAAVTVISPLTKMSALF